MKKYEKVPRWDHPCLEDTELWEADDLRLLEKMDGQNYKWFLFDETMDYYIENVLENENLPTNISIDNIKDGDIVFGTKNVIRGTTSMNKNEIEAKYNRAYDVLKNVNKEKIREYHDKYGAIIFFSEHMIPHTIKSYYHGENKVPGLLGFDIYVPSRDNRESYASNPYEQKFNGYLETETAKQIFEDIGVEFVPILETDEKISGLKDIEEMSVPTSKFSNSPAEGVVIRSDKLKLRSKKRSPDFEELNKKSWGMNPDEANTGEEWLIAKTVTSSRVRKIFEKIKNSNKDFDEISRRTLEDIWEEELEIIRSMNMEINPYNAMNEVKNRVEGELEKIIETSRVVNDYETGLPNKINDINTDINLKRIKIDSNNVEDIIVEKYATEELIMEVAEEIVEGNLEKSHIEDIYVKAAEEMWYRNWRDIMRIDAYFTPSKITNLVAKKTANIVTEKVEN